MAGNLVCGIQHYLDNNPSYFLLALVRCKKNFISSFFIVYQQLLTSKLLTKNHYINCKNSDATIPFYMCI